MRDRCCAGRSSVLSDLSSPQVGKLASEGAVLAVPLGSTEQHGPHLPLSTDTDIALALCLRLAATNGDVLVAPAVSYGSSGEHREFPGTLSIGQQALELLVLELGRSATDTFTHVIFVCAHGGNAAPLRRAVSRLRSESREVLVFMPRVDGDPHAGHSETSMMLALKPAQVQMQHAVPGDTRPLAQTWPLLRVGGLRAVSESGVLGDPTQATSLDGLKRLDELTDLLVREVAIWRSEVRP